MIERISSEFRVIGKYQIQRELGRGGMGVVYLATDTDLDREVALKMVQPSLARDARSLARFKKEARAVAALSHPNIVHINALTEVDSVLLIEMPYLPHGSLRDVSRTAMGEGLVASILDSILDALACCHDSGIIHRDVKPSNILFDANGVPKLSDFGAVALMESDWAAGQGERTMTLSFSGTPQYCCPEAWDGQAPTPRWDLYALGMVARELLEGDTARPLSSPLSHIRQLLESEEVPIRALVPELSAPFGALLDGLCARDPEKRPRSAAEAQDRLRDTPEFARVSRSDAHTIEIGRALRASRARRTSSRTWWPRRLRLALRAIPWVLVGVLGLLTVVLALNRTEAPINAPAEPRESRRATAPPPPTQQALFQQATPDATALAGLVRESVVGRSAIFTLRAAGLPDEQAPFILRNAPEAGAVSAMGLMGGYVHCLTLTPDAEGGAYAVSGFAGDYATGGTPVLRLARVKGEAQWSGALADGFWIHLNYMSDLSQESWDEVALAAPDTGGQTDTAVILDWERHPAAMPFVFRELFPRFPVLVAPALELLPALADARLTAAPGLATRDVAAAASVEAAHALFGAGLPGRPVAGGGWLAADREAASFRVVVGIPGGASPSGVDLCVMPRYGVPLEDSPFLHVALHDGSWSAARVDGAERGPVATGWSAEVLERPDGHLVVVTLDRESLYWGGEPAPGEWHRLNALVEQEGAGEFVHHEWGWPEIEALHHGALVELKF